MNAQVPGPTLPVRPGSGHPLPHIRLRNAGELTENGRELE